MSLVLPSVQAREEQSRVTDTVMKLVCVCTQAAIKTISYWQYTPLWPSLSLSLTYTHTHKVIKMADVLWCDPVSLSLSLSLSHTHTHNAKTHITHKAPYLNSQ